MKYLVLTDQLSHVLLGLSAHRRKPRFRRRLFILDLVEQSILARHLGLGPLLLACATEERAHATTSWSSRARQHARLVLLVLNRLVQSHTKALRRMIHRIWMQLAHVIVSWMGALVYEHILNLLVRLLFWPVLSLFNSFLFFLLFLAISFCCFGIFCGLFALLFS